MALVLALALLVQLVPLGAAHPPALADDSDEEAGSWVGEVTGCGAGGCLVGVDVAIVEQPGYKVQYSWTAATISDLGTRSMHRTMICTTAQFSFGWTNTHNPGGGTVVFGGGDGCPEGVATFTLSEGRGYKRTDRWTEWTFSFEPDEEQLAIAGFGDLVGLLDVLISLLEQENVEFAIEGTTLLIAAGEAIRFTNAVCTAVETEIVLGGQSKGNRYGTANEKQLLAPTVCQMMSAAVGIAVPVAVDEFIAGFQTPPRGRPTGPGDVPGEGTGLEHAPGIIGNEARLRDLDCIEPADPDHPGDPGGALTPYDLYVFGRSPKNETPVESGAHHDFEQHSSGDVCKEFDMRADGNVLYGKSAFTDPLNTDLTGHYYRLRAGSRPPDGIALVADGPDKVPGSPHPPGHHTLYPTRRMSFSEFNAKITTMNWEHWGNKRK